MPRLRLLLATLFCCLTFLAATEALADEKLRVFVTIAPQAFLAERLGGEAVEVHTLVGKGQDPHTFEPSPRQAATLGRAHLFFTVGLPFEKQLVAKAAANNRNIKVSDSTIGITRLMMQEHHHDQDAAHHGHVRGEPDPHLWLAPANLTIMTKNMAAALTAALPEHRETVRRSQQALLDELAALDRQLAASLAPHRGKTFYVFHPAFGYFANAYGLTQEAVETGGKSPSPKRLTALVRQAKVDGVKVIFVQPQFDAKAAATVAAGIGGAVVPIDPLAREVTANLSSIAGAIDQAFRQQPAPGGTKGK
ncbi:MAG: zinc ABC transporter substrate-binding protein [Thermodesulfobacteriota bacterium]